MSDDRRIVYQFVASGANAVQEAYRGNARAAVESARASNQAEQAAARASRASTARAGRSPADLEARRTEVAARRAASEQEKALRHVSGIKDRYLRDDQSRQERADRKAAQDQERAQRNISQIKERYFREEQARQEKLAAKAERARSRSIDRTHGDRLSQIQGYGKGARDLAMSGATTALFAGTALVGSAAYQRIGLDSTANRISINARKSGEDFIDPGSLVREFSATSAASPGIGAAEVADAVQRFISLTGDVKTAREGQGTFATVASASGANIGDVAEAAASLAQQFDVKSINDMRDALAALTFQGKEGAFELKDAAAQFQRLAASGAAFGIPKGVQGVKTLGGLTQIARTGTGSAEQAATAVENMLTQFKAKSAILGKQGINVFKDGKARPVEDLIVDTISRVGGGDVAKKQAGLTSIFGEQGIRAINPLVSTYNDTFRSAKGTDKERAAVARSAVSAQLDKSINAAGTYADVQRDAAQAQADSSAKLSAAWERLSNQLGETLEPHIVGLADRIGDADGAIDALVGTTDVLLSGFEALVDLLATIPGLKGTFGRKLDPERDVKKAERALDKVDKELAAKGLDATPQDIAKRNAAQKDVADARQRKYDIEHISDLPTEQASALLADIGNKQTPGEAAKSGALKGGLLSILGPQALLLPSILTDTGQNRAQGELQGKIDQAGAERGIQEKAQADFAAANEQANKLGSSLGALGGIIDSLLRASAI